MTRRTCKTVQAAVQGALGAELEKLCSVRVRPHRMPGMPPSENAVPAVLIQTALHRLSCELVLPTPGSSHVVSVEEKHKADAREATKNLLRAKLVMLLDVTAKLKKQLEYLGVNIELE